jgi:3-hydroxyisobutyrate dehydrogenase-like beta-hydroxyacid dehydrogenase
MRPFSWKSSGQMATVSKVINNALTLVLVVSLIESLGLWRSAGRELAVSSLSAMTGAVG